jgi:hypothetical protein
MLCNLRRTDAAGIEGSGLTQLSATILNLIGHRLMLVETPHRRPAEFAESRGLG